MNKKSSSSDHADNYFPEPPSAARLRPSSSRRGFTLIASLFLSALLLLLITAFGTFLFLTQHSVSSERYAGYAKQSALFGLQVALGELQGAAGPDQRITAGSSLFNGTTLDYPAAAQTAPSAGQGAWTGVWSSDSKPLAPDTRPQANPAYPQYDPSTPGSKAGDFVGWLVSGTGADGYFSIPTSLSAVAAPVSSTPASGSIPNYVALAPPTGTGNSTTPYIQVQKIPIDQIPGGSRYCAFSVEDEGVKANLSWDQTPASVASGMAAGQAQDIRLSSAPGPDFGQLNGSGNDEAPFPATVYPLTAANDSFLANAVPLLRDPADIQTILAATSPGQSWPAWLALSRPDITAGSKGVLADVQRGGLRRDLSLAFEMDGNSQFGYKADATQINYINASPTGPPLFNQAVGEFVGGGSTDPLSTPASDPGSGMSGYIPYSGGNMPFLQRYVYRHQAAPNDLQRGPDWHLLRDYYNLYKRLGSSSLTARATYPNVCDWPRTKNTPSMFNSISGLTADSKPNAISGEFGVTYQYVTSLGAYPAPGAWHYNWKPLQGQYAPVYLGTTWLYSVAFVDSVPASSSTKDMVLCVDKLFYIWNPYNRILYVPAFRLFDSSYMPGWLNYTTQDKNGVRYWGSTDGQATSPPPAYDCASVSVPGQGQYHLFYGPNGLTTPFYMQPGEVKVFSPVLTSGISEMPKTSLGASIGAVEGYSFSGTQGRFFRNFPAIAGSTTYATAANGASTPPITVDFSTLSSVSLTLSIQNRNISGGGFQSETATSLPSPLSPVSTGTSGTYEDDLQQFILEQDDSTGSDGENSPVYPGKPGTVTITGTFQPNTKYFFGQISSLRKPTKPSGSAAMEVFSRLNPMPLSSSWGDPRVVPFNSTFSASVLPDNIPPYSTAAIQFLLGNVPTSIPSPGTAHWGNSFGSDGASFIPMLNIPSGPLYSLEALNGATINSWAQEPFQPLGNSWPSPYLGPVAPAYGTSPPLQGIESGFSNGQPEYNQHILSDVSWYLNDGLFDRYYFSGLVPPFDTGASYTSNGTLKDTLNKFFGAGYPNAGANPVLHPYLPSGVTAAQAVTDLSTVPDGGGTTVAGFNKVGAYSLVDGAFNINSTSVPAWTAFLMANKNLPVGTDSGAGTPFPSSTQPAGVSGDMWGGFSRLTDAQIATLATNIVQQVHLRGPFMSLSDFINHRIVNDATGNCGALQAAINASSLNGAAAAVGTTPNYSGAGFFSSQANQTSASTTAAGLPGYISQANLLLPLAPRLSARSDTFRIRSYGEVRLASGIAARAACEAVVQRIPEYVDSSNKPWDEGPPGSISPNAGLKPLTTINQYLGRRFKIVQFRWLNPNEL